MNSTPGSITQISANDSFSLSVQIHDSKPYSLISVPWITKVLTSKCMYRLNTAYGARNEARTRWEEHVVSPFVQRRRVLLLVVSHHQLLAPTMSTRQLVPTFSFNWEMVVPGVSYQDTENTAGWTPVIGKLRKRPQLPPNVLHRFPPDHSLRRNQSKSDSLKQMKKSAFLRMQMRMCALTYWMECLACKSWLRTPPSGLQ